jgi:hypothetical protein
LEVVGCCLEAKISNGDVAIRRTATFPAGLDGCQKARLSTLRWTRCRRTGTFDITFYERQTSIPMPRPVREWVMDGITFVHEGRSGRWVCTLRSVSAPEAGFSASADIARNGQLQCKLVLCLPNTAGADGFEQLRRKCIAWIEQAEMNGVSA